MTNTATETPGRATHEICGAALKDGPCLLPKGHDGTPRQAGRQRQASNHSRRYYRWLDPKPQVGA
jgi:hypothetical protein